MDGGTLLRRCRELAGLSQRQLAERAGTSAAAVCNYERGDRIPRTTTLARLVAATGATLTLDVHPASAIDRAVNGHTLVELLDLVDQLPQRHHPTLEAPPFAQSIARAAR